MTPTWLVLASLVAPPPTEAAAPEPTGVCTPEQLALLTIDEPDVPPAVPIIDR